MGQTSRRGNLTLPAAAALAWGLLWAPPAGGGTDLGGEATRIAREQLRRFPEGYTAHIDPRRHIVYISALDDKHLQATIRCLGAFTDAFRRTMPVSRPAWNITVVLPTVDDYRKLKLPHEKCIGFYSHAGRRLVSIDRGRTLLHEFTHALHHADAAASKQVHPPWIREGLATLFEASRITPSGLKPQVDLRLPALQQALKDKKALPLSRLLSMGHDAFMKDAELAYPQCRYVMLYLYRQGRLRSWYRLYKTNFTRDPDGIQSFAKALGNRLFLIEPEWKKWVLSLKMPANEHRLRQGRLGLEVKKTAQGVQVVGLVKDSAAKRAGRIRVGDVINAFNGQPIKSTADLIGAIRGAGAMQTVRIELRRHGRKMTVIQPLGAPTAR